MLFKRKKKLKKEYDLILLKQIEKVKKQWDNDQRFVQRSIEKNIDLEIQIKLNQLKFVHLFKEAKHRKVSLSDKLFK